MTPISPMQDISIGVAHFSAIHLSPSELVVNAAAAGFKSVGLRLNPAFPGAPSYELPKGSKAAAEFRSLLDGEGMRVFDIEFFIIGPEFSAAAIEPIVAAAADIGAKRLSACGDDTNHDRLLGNFIAFCALAARYGMSADLENMGWRTVKTYEDSAALVQSSGQSNAGALVDAIHFFRNGGRVDEINIDIVRHLQLCDVAGPAPQRPEDMVAEARSGRLAPGDGDLPLEKLLAKLAGTAHISVEVPLVGNGDAVAHLKNLFQRTRLLFSQA